MHSSVRAVEAYRRSRMIDGVTFDEDKVAPVYRLEEICQVLRSSPSDICREMLEHTMKRLEHKSPVVKQKTLRFMKYASTKGGPDFKRDLQRQAGVIKSLFHYKGQLDALKGDALNKAVRDTAHETIAALFGSEEKAATMEEMGKRIQGFGSTNYEKPREEEKKSVFSGLVGFGSQSIKQSIDMLNNYNHYSGSGSGSNKNSFSGTYRVPDRSQGLRRSLTAEREAFEREARESWNLRDSEASDEGPGPFPKVSPTSKAELSNGKHDHSDGSGHNAVEDRLLNSLTTPGGVRLQPTRETLQTFTTAAQKLDAANLVNSLETKLRAHNWQVRFKALCLLEALLRERDSKVFDSVAAMFKEDANAVIDCLSSPQTSLRDKAKKVLDILGANGKDNHAGGTESDTSSAPLKPSVADLPDLMDTRDLDFNYETDSLQSTSVAENVPPTVPTNVVPPIEQYLFGDWVEEPSANPPPKEADKEVEADPFAGMSFHSADDAAGSSAQPDLFSGLDVDASNRVANHAMEGSVRNDGASLFGSESSSQGVKAVPSLDNVVDLFASLSTSNGTPPGTHKGLGNLQNLSPLNHLVHQPIAGLSSANFTSDMNLTKFLPTQQQGNGRQPGAFTGNNVPPQTFVFPPGAQFGNGVPTGISGHFPANIMLQQSFAAGPMNYTGMPGPFAQQQLPHMFPGVMRYGQNLQTHSGNGVGGNQNYSDSFDFSGDPVSRYATTMENTKKEDTKAFDFISAHVSSQLGPKKNR